MWLCLLCGKETGKKEKAKGINRYVSDLFFVTGFRHEVEVHAQKLLGSTAQWEEYETVTLRNGMA